MEWTFETQERQARWVEQRRAAPEVKQGRLRLVDGLVRGAHWPEAIATMTAKLGADPRGDSRPYGCYLSKIRVSIVWKNKRPCGGSFGCKLGAALEVPPQCRYNSNKDLVWGIRR